MPSCFVPMCNSGYERKNRYLRENGIPLPHFFTPPNEEQRAKWAAVIKRYKETLTLKSTVCSDHFLEGDYITHDVTILPNGEVVKIPRLRAKLKSNDIVPSVFPKFPTYYETKRQKRKSPKKREVPAKRSKVTVGLEPENKILEQENPDQTEKGEDEPNNEGIEKGGEEPNNEEKGKGVSDTEEIIAWSSCQAVDKIKMPLGWVICNRLDQTEKVVVHIDEKNLQIDRSVTFKDGEPPKVKIMHIEYDITSYAVDFKCVDDVQKFMNKLSLARPCAGTGVKTKKYSVHCVGGLTSPNMKRCKGCQAEKERLLYISTYLAS